jgi:hypothetical protein
MKGLKHIPNSHHGTSHKVMLTVVGRPKPSHRTCVLLVFSLDYAHVDCSSFFASDDLRCLSFLTFFPLVDVPSNHQYIYGFTYHLHLHLHLLLTRRKYLHLRRACPDIHPVIGHRSASSPHILLSPALYCITSHCIVSIHIEVPLPSSH